MMTAARVAVLLLLFSATTSGQRFPEPPPIVACLWQPTLPASIFREEYAHGYGSRRVQWHVMQRNPLEGLDDGATYFYDAPGPEESTKKNGEASTSKQSKGLRCDALFWEDEDWFPPEDYYTTFRQQNKKATPRLLSRVVAGWVSERCLRSQEIKDTYDFVWYPAAHDGATHLTPLPLGTSQAFPDTGTCSAADLQSFEFLFNYLASLETAPVRRTWFTEAKLIADKLRHNTSDETRCAFVRAHGKWQEPESYGEARDGEENMDLCNCATLDVCNNVTVGSLASAQFCSILRRSAFTLSPPGHNYQSFRHWEAASMGSIPVVVDPSRSKNECVRSESYFFNNAPFLFAPTPHDAIEPMLTLVRNPAALTERRRRVSDWYEMQTYAGVRRVEAAMTAASAMAGAVHFDSTPTVPVVLGQQPSRKQKRNAFLLTVDESLSNQLLVWLRNTHGVGSIGRKYVDELRDDGAITVGWAYAGAFSEDDTTVVSPANKNSKDAFAAALQNAMMKEQPLASVAMAPIVLVARDPLEYVPALANLIQLYAAGNVDRVLNHIFRAEAGDAEDSEDAEDAEAAEADTRHFTSYFHEAVLAAASSLSLCDTNGKNCSSLGGCDPNDKNCALRLAARYWFEWTRRAYAVSTFDFRAESLDPIALLHALGLKRQPALMNAHLKPFALVGRNASSPQCTTWEDLAQAGVTEANDMRALSYNLGYSA